MISYKYNFDEFVVFVKDKDLAEIIRYTRQECYEAERRIAGGMRGAPKAREEGCPQYVNLLKGLLFFLGNGIKPGGVNDWDFQSYRPIVESLVNRGIMSGDYWLKLLGKSV